MATFEDIMHDVEVAIIDACQKHIFEASDQYTENSIRLHITKIIDNVYMQGYYIKDYHGDPIFNREDVDIIIINMGKYTAQISVVPTQEYIRIKMEKFLEYIDRSIAPIYTSDSLGFL